MKIAMMTEMLLRYNLSQEECFKYIKEFGYEAIDITLFDKDDCSKPQKEMFNDDYIEHAKYLRKVADDLGLPIIQCHTPFPIHKDNDEEYDKNILDIMKKSLKICGILGVKNCVIHPWNNWNYLENKNFYEKLLPIAKENNVIIATENMWNWDKENNRAAKASCSYPDDYLKLCESIDNPYFGACVDIGHCNMFSFDNVSAGKMIKTLNKYVTCFHIHDNDGIHDNHAIPYTMNLDFDEFIKSVKEINYKGDLVVETALNTSLPLNDIKNEFIMQKDIMNKIKNRILE